MNEVSTAPLPQRPVFKRRSWWAVAWTLLVLLVTFVALVMSIGCDRSHGARYSRIQGDLNALRLALDNYQTHSSTLPTTEQGLKALTEKPTVAPVPANHMRIMKLVPRDPWGREYQYRAPAKESDEGYDVWSAGPDGLDGTADDVGNWNDE